MSQASIDILLATWNGEAYLPVQLASLAAQTDQDFRILARDDGSHDGTVALLEKFNAQHPGKLELVIDDKQGGSASANFSLLMEATTADYVMFCDQDDQWLPEKIEKTRAVMSELEHQHQSNTPLLVHTDLEVVDGSLHQLDSSFWHFQKLDPSWAHRLNRAMVQNVVTGCTMMINRALLSLGHPIANEAIMHDWWLTMVATSFGSVGEVSAATMKYRQHASNDTGAKHWSASYILKKCTTFLDRDELMGNFTKTCLQAKAFLDRFGDRLNDQQRQQVSAYANLLHAGWLSKRLTIFKHGFFKIGLIRNLGLLARI